MAAAHPPPEGRRRADPSPSRTEFNAINLALDAIWRFPACRRAVLDWLRVAEEAKHFARCAATCASIWATTTETFPHHLWACAKTAHDITARMALVPRTMEARGLDATPADPAISSAAWAPATRYGTIPDIILCRGSGARGHRATIGMAGYCARQRGWPGRITPSWLRHEAPRPKPLERPHAAPLPAFTEAELALATPGGATYQPKWAITCNGDAHSPSRPAPPPPQPPPAWPPQRRVAA